MNHRAPRWAFLSAVIVLAFYATIFPLLTIDTLTKILHHMAGYETRSLFLLLYLEFSRLFTSVVAVTIAIVLIARGRERADVRALAMFLLFATITYEKVFGTNGLPGPVQERMTEALFAAGASPKILQWLFGPVAWSIWPTVAALLRFSTVFPHDLHADALEASGRADRQGFMRSTGVVGADVGALFRGISRRVLSAGGYRPLVLSGAAIVMVAGHTALAGTRASLGLWLVTALAGCIAVTNIRAAYVTSDGTDRVRITWIVEGFVLALLMFLISAVVLLIIHTPAAVMAGFVLIMLAPATVMVCMALSVLDRGELDTQTMIDQTVRNGTIILVLTLIFGVLYGLIGFATDYYGMSRALAALAAAISTGIGFEAIRLSTDRLRLKILERSSSEGPHQGRMG